MLHRQMVGALALAYGLVIFAWAWPQDYRQEAAWYAGTAWIAFLIRTFLFWGGWLVVAGAVAAGCYGWRKIALAALPLIAFTLGPTLATWWPRHISPAAGEQGLKVMTLNLLASNDERRPVFQAIRDADPDVLFLQELTESWDAALRAELDDLFPHRYSEPRDDCFGMAVFSKLPLEDVRFDLALGSGLVPQFRGRVRVDSQEIALYQVHFPPPHRLSHIREHRAQFADLLFKLEREVLPAVVVGDFNFSASSPQVADLRRLGFIDAHDQAGRGPGWTWPAPGYAPWMPRLRLDHLYIGEPLRAVECIGGPSVGSDHRPVVARIVYP